MHTTAPTISTDLIDDSDRQRTDYGDLTSLAESIQSIGLIHPIVISDTPLANGKHELVAGGRRLATFRALGLVEIPYNFRSVLDAADLRESELEENLQRKDMTWQEYALGIATIHELRQLRVNFDTSQWGARQTAQLLGLRSHASVVNALSVARALRQNNTEVAAASNLTDALAILLGQKEAAVTTLLAKTETIQRTPVGLAALSIDISAGTTPTVSTSGSENDPNAKPAFVWTDTNIALSRTVVEGDCIQVMSLMQPGSVDHIITDPPYGISMKNLETFVDIDRVEAEHDVTENLSLLPLFFQKAFYVLRDPGFCITWCDMQHFEKMMSWATDAGFKVQRWPLIWVKSHPCINNSAQYNFTKDTEAALVCRKGNATLVSPQPTSVITANGATERKMYRNPFAKPFAVWKWLFDATCIPGQTVLDPFAGEGSMPSAAINCGLRPVCIEKAPQHYVGLVENVKKAYLLATHGKAVFS